MEDQAHINMYRKDAATFRDLLDQLFHNCPTNKDGLFEPNDHAKAIWRKLSEHTYRGGKGYVQECRAFLKSISS